MPHKNDFLTLELDGVLYDLHRFPPHLRSALGRYLLYGIEPGAFTLALLHNDLTSAALHADAENRGHLCSLALLVYHQLPPTAQGSPLKVASWIKRRKQYWIDHQKRISSAPPADGALPPLSSTKLRSTT